MRITISFRRAFAAFSLSALALLLSSCATAPSSTASRRLPAWEPPMAKNDFQLVRTTAYTHSESDHLAYGSHNALGGQLQSATVPSRRVEAKPRAQSPRDSDDSSFITFSYMTRMQRITAEKRAEAKARKGKGKPSRSSKHSRKPEPPRIGSAAADWARWPVGTKFRILSTGQVYNVDDTGWALSGRNTIDLYMSSRGDMNQWGVRNERIQILHWGSPEMSLALLQSRQKWKHCRRMALELQGLHEQAAGLQ